MGTTPKIGIQLEPARKEAIAEARGAINDILKAIVSDAVKIEALVALRSLCAISNVSISNNTVSMS